MATRKCERLLADNPIIPAIRNPRDIHDAIDSPSQIIFLLTGNIYNLKTMVDYINAADKYAFVHLDLLKGYAQDHYFVRYLKEKIRPEGVISTRNSLIVHAKKEGLMTIERLFLLDSSALEVTLTSAKKIKPDAVEILPGVAPKIISRVRENLTTPIITGGFVETEEEVQAAIAAGSYAASTSYKPLWQSLEKMKTYAKTIKRQENDN